MLKLDDVKQAHNRIKGVVQNTPLTYAPILSQTSGFEVHLKKENLQLTGAFKLRGAFNAVASLVESKGVDGIVAASAGNHAQGIAYSAKHFGIKATIVMPESTPLTKVQGVTNLGGEVILHGANYDEAYAYGLEYASSNNFEFVHPFEDLNVMAGQGTIAMEILEALPNLDAIVVPVGGGGLISGIATVVKAINPKIKVIGIASAGAPAMKNSFDQKQPIDSLSVRTIADGIAVRDTSPITLEHILKDVDALELVEEEEIAYAILFLLERQKILVEGAGAVGVAALLHNKIKMPSRSRIAIVLSGGNIDVTMLSLIIEKGLVKSSRKLKLQVTLVDKPGSLMLFTQLLKEVGANIVQIGYDRTSTDLKFGDAHVSVALETKGIEHQDQIRSILRKHKFAFIEEH
ncbi:MAG: threonine ammonia-lyase [Campylobacterales bacterium]|nr:threonine ammonia-lyase [Campylobacterales bacterium]